MSAAPAPPTAVSFDYTSGLYCPGCEEPYAPAPPHHPPVLLSPCGHSLCAACFAALPPPAWCSVCDKDVQSYTKNAALVELAAEVLCEAGGGLAESPSHVKAACVEVTCVRCGAYGSQDVQTTTVSDHGGAGKRRSRKKRSNAAAAPAPPLKSSTLVGGASSASHVGSVHAQQLMYCVTHKAILCGRCAAGEHAAPGCNVVSAVEAQTMLRQRASVHARKCADAATTKYPAAISRVQAALDGLKQQHAACRERAIVDIDAIVAGLEAHRVRVLGQLDGMYKERVKSLESTLDRLMVSVSQLEACVAAEAKHAVSAEVDVVKAAELESLCAGMSALADAYVGVDVSPCMSVSVDVSGVLAAVEASISIDECKVDGDMCVLTGHGIRGFANEISAVDDVSAYNRFRVRCVDGNEELLTWVAAEDVCVRVKGIVDADSDTSDDYDSDGDDNANCASSVAAPPTQYVPCIVQLCNEGGGVVLATYKLATSPSLTRGRGQDELSTTTVATEPSTHQRVKKVEVYASVCGQPLYRMPFRVKDKFTPIHRWAAMHGDECGTTGDLAGVLDVMSNFWDASEVVLCVRALVVHLRRFPEQAYAAAEGAAVVVEGPSLYVRLITLLHRFLSSYKNNHDIDEVCVQLLCALLRPGRGNGDAAGNHNVHRTHVLHAFTSDDDANQLFPLLLRVLRGCEGREAADTASGVCLVVYELCRDSPGRLDAFAACDGWPALMHAMKAQAHDTNVLYYGCLMIVECRRQGGNGVLRLCPCDLCDADISVLVLRAVCVLADVPWQVEAALSCLRMVTQESPKASLALVIALGGIETLAALMRRYPGQPVVQVHSMMLLGAMSDNAIAVRAADRVIAAGVVDLLWEALEDVASGRGDVWQAANLALDMVGLNDHSLTLGMARWGSSEVSAAVERRMGDAFAWADQPVTRSRQYFEEMD